VPIEEACLDFFSSRRWDWRWKVVTEPVCFSVRAL